MLSYQVFEYYQYVLDQLGNFRKAIGPMLDFANKYNSGATQVLHEILGDAQVIKSSDGKFHYILDDGNLVDNFKNILVQFKSSFQPLQAFAEYGQVKQNVEKYMQDNQINDKEIETFFNKVKENFNLYQEFLQSSDDRKKAASFGQSNIAFSAAFEAIQTFYSNAVTMLSDKDVKDLSKENKQTINIQLLHTNFTLEQFTENLTAINRIYQEIGSIIGHSSDGVGYTQLQIVKIESGSLMAMLLGDKNIMDAVGLLLNKTVELVFRKFTVEGQLTRHSELMTALKENAEVNKQLTESGYDLSSAREDIQKTYAVATKKLLRIALSSSSAKIDNQIYSVGEGLYGSQKFLKDAKALYLTDNSENKTSVQ